MPGEGVVVAGHPSRLQASLELFKILSRLRLFLNRIHACSLLPILFRICSPLFDSQLGTHPGVNTALKLDGLPNWKNCVTGSWTLFFFSRLHEPIRRAIGLRLEHHILDNDCPCRAFRSRVRVSRKHVQWNNKPTTEFCNLSESVHLTARVPEAERLANRHIRLTGSKHPKESVLMLRNLCNEFIKRSFPASDTGAWKRNIERKGFAIVGNQDGLASVFRLVDDRKPGRQQTYCECSEDGNSNEFTSSHELSFCDRTLRFTPLAARKTGQTHLGALARSKSRGLMPTRQRRQTDETAPRDSVHGSSFGRVFQHREQFHRSAKTPC